MESNYFKKAKPISIKDALLYEIHSHWLAPHVSNPLLQNVLGNYFAWKVSRKYRRYRRSMAIRNNINKSKNNSLNNY